MSGDFAGQVVSRTYAQNGGADDNRRGAKWPTHPVVFYLFGPPRAWLLVVVQPLRTETLPQSKRNGLEGPDPITALRIRGADVEYVMLAGQPRFALGSLASCEIFIDRRYISSLHAMLERRENRIRVFDVSKNGIVFRGRFEKQFDIGPGDSFSIGDTTCYVLNDEMRLARPVLTEVLGAQRFEAIDDLTMAAMHGDHVLLLGEPGNDQERLARAIHSASLRRRHHFVRAFPDEDGRLDRQLISYAERGTLWLDLEPARINIDPDFIEQLLLPDANVRVVISARTLDITRKCVGIDLVGRAHQVAIPPLRERAGEIAALLERSFIERRSSLRLADFTERNQAALLAYKWPSNLEELRNTADRLVQLAPFTKERAAAIALKIPRTTLQRWLDSLGLELPLLRTVNGH